MLILIRERSPIRSFHLPTKHVLLLIACLLCAGRAAAESWQGASKTCARPTRQPALVFAEVYTDDSGAGQQATLWTDGMDRLYASVSQIRAWAGVTPNPTPVVMVEGVRWYPLKHYLDGRMTFDWCQQRLDIQSPMAALPLSRYDLAQQSRVRTLPRMLGVTLGLNLSSDFLEHGRSQPAGTTKLAVFGPLGYASSSWLGSRVGILRLNSSYTYDRPGRLQRLQLGDAITDAQGFTTPVRYGGVQFGTDFGLQPQFIPFPVGQLSGSAAVPSTLELYRNGALQSSRQIPAGRFELTDVPIVNGNGDLQLVVRNALGQSVVVTQPVYGSSQRLRGGLSAYSFEAGFLRVDYATRQDHYSQQFFAFEDRYGVSDETTIGARIESTGAQHTLAENMVTAWPGIGEFSLSVNASMVRDLGLGGALGLGFQRSASVFSFGGSVRFASPDYAELGRAPGDLKRQVQAFVGASLPYRASLNLAYSEQSLRSSGRIALRVVSFNLPIMRRGYLSLSWSKPVGGSSFFGLNFTQSFGGNLSGSVGLSHDDQSGFSEQAGVQQNTSGVLGTSWRVLAERGAVNGVDAGVQHTASIGSAGAEVSTLGGINDLRLNASAGLAWFGGAPLFTRNLDQSFALVDVPGVSGARVYHENQLVGRTDDEGQLLVPDLLPYQATHLSVAPQDLPLDRPLLDDARTVAVPPGGSRVSFNLAAGHHVSLRLQATDRTRIPAGAMIELDGRPDMLPVGYGGVIYLNVSAPHRLRVSWAHGTCQAEVPAATPAGTVIICETVK